MKVKKQTTLLSFLILFITTNAICQTIDFKLIKAIKSKELIREYLERSNLIQETDVLPDDKRYLIITAEVNNSETENISIKKKDINLNNDIPILGRLRHTKRAFLGWPSFSVKPNKGNYYFSAIFLVNKNLNEAVLSLNSQKFEIKKINDEPHASLICTPQVTSEEKEYLQEIIFEDVYYNNNRQKFTRKIIPNSGKFIKIKIKAQYCNNIEYYRKKSFTTRADHFILEDEAGKSYSCLGTLDVSGKLSGPGNLTSQIGTKKSVIDRTYRLIFNVPKEGNYKLKYLGEVISDI